MSHDKPRVHDDRFTRKCHPAHCLGINMPLVTALTDMKKSVRPPSHRLQRPETASHSKTNSTFRQTLRKGKKDGTLRQLPAVAYRISSRNLCSLSRKVSVHPQNNCRRQFHKFTWTITC